MAKPLDPKLLAEIRARTEQLFEAPSRYSPLEEIRDNLWDIYIAGDLPRGGGAAARRAYNEIFEEVANARGFGKDGELRRRYMYQLSRTLQDDVRGYKKIDPDEFAPTPDDLAKIKQTSISLNAAFLDLAVQLVGLEEVELYGDERVKGLAKSIAAALPAPNVRKLTLNTTNSEGLAGAIENPAWTKLDYLALYDCQFTAAHIAAAVAHWKLATLAIRSGSKLGAKTFGPIGETAPTLVELALVDTNLSDAQIRDLVLGRPWPKLKRLYLSGNNIGAPLLKEIKAKLPGAKVSAT